jgi:UDP-galactopyranose mutase
MKITISELRQIIIEEVEHEAQLEEQEELKVDRANETAKAMKRDRIPNTKIRKFLEDENIDEYVIRNIMSQVKHMEEYMEESLNEELTKTDKAEIKRMISKELDSSLQKELKKALEEELAKALKSKDIKTDIGEISKKVLKKLYKDLSFHHPYIIDRIKV